MAKNTFVLQKYHKKVLVLVLSAIFPFLVLANPEPTSDDWEEWLESQAKIEQVQDDNDNSSKVETTTPQIRCPDLPECKG